MVTELVVEEDSARGGESVCVWRECMCARVLCAVRAHLHVWSVETRKPTYALPGHQGSVLDVKFHPSQPIIASSGAGGEIFLGELEL